MARKDGGGGFQSRALRKPVGTPHGVTLCHRPPRLEPWETKCSAADSGEIQEEDATVTRVSLFVRARTVDFRVPQAGRMRLGLWRNGRAPAGGACSRTSAATTPTPPAASTRSSSCAGSTTTRRGAPQNQPRDPSHSARATQRCFCPSKSPRSVGTRRRPPRSHSRPWPCASPPGASSAGTTS